MSIPKTEQGNSQQRGRSAGHLGTVTSEKGELSRVADVPFYSMPRNYGSGMGLFCACQLHECDLMPKGSKCEALAREKCAQVFRREHVEIAVSDSPENNRDGWTYSRTCDRQV